MKTLWKSLLLAGMFLLPGLVMACPMCQSGFSQKSIFAYKMITLFLTALPLAMGGGIFWWVRKNRTKQPSK